MISTLEKFFRSPYKLPDNHHRFRRLVRVPYLDYHLIFSHCWPTDENHAELERREQDSLEIIGRAHQPNGAV